MTLPLEMYVSIEKPLITIFQHFVTIFMLTVSVIELSYTGITNIRNMYV